MEWKFGVESKSDRFFFISHMSQFIFPVVAGAALTYGQIKAEQAANQAVSSIVKAPYYGLRSAYNYMDSRKRLASSLGTNKEARYKEPGHDSLGRYAPITYGPSRPVYSVPKTTQKELGFIDGFVNGSLTTIGSIHHVNIIPNGTSASSRVGKKVTMKYIQMRGIAYNGSTSLFTNCAFVLVYDIRPGTTLPSITDILNSSSPFSMNNDSNNGRFKILHREDFSLIGNSSSVSGANLTPSFIKNMAQFQELNKKTEYGNTGTGAIGDVALGGLYMMFIGDQVGTAGATCAINYRIRYQDD